MNVLGASEKPLFFRVAGDPGFAPGSRATRGGESVRTQVRSLSVMQKEALVVSSRTGQTWRLASDEGAYLNGDDEAPCPLSFVTTGMVCSFMRETIELARSRRIEIGDIELILDNYYTMQGSALKGTMTGGARDVVLDARITSTASRETLTQLLHDAVAAAPVSGLTRGRHSSLFTLSHNGHVVDSKGVGKLDAPFSAPADDSVHDAAMPAAGDWSVLITRAGMSPATDEITSSAGSSLADEQDRVLHVRGICRVRPDGLLHVEQQLFNPHGSIFHYLCDTDPGSQGGTRAPDPLSYISAGIAFCFMTQFGRYAKITRKNLRDYRILQDSHFSPVTPVETHVALASDEDDGFAQTALAMAEQTCFLHALCRTDLKTHVRLAA